MKVIEITHASEGLVDLLNVISVISDMSPAIDSIRVGIDPLDNSLKFSVNWGTWSPPIYGLIQ